MPRAKINNIQIDWVQLIPKNLEGEVTKHTIQGGKKDDISSHIKLENRVIEMECTILGTDKNIRYEALYELGRKKAQVQLQEQTLSFLRFNNKNNQEVFAITKLEQTGQGENFIDFSLTLEVLNFSQLKMTKTSVKTQKVGASTGSKKVTQAVLKEKYGIGTPTFMGGS